MKSTPLPRLPKRQPDGHKGTYGRALLIGGSRGMSGSIALSGLSCLKSGAGLVTLAVPHRCLETVASFHPAYMTMPLPDDANGALSKKALPKIHELLEAKDAAAVGPGLGQSADVQRIVQELFASAPCPLVIDADGLNALAKAGDALKPATHPRILTPHPGEFARLEAALLDEAKETGANDAGGAEPDRDRQKAAAKLLASKLNSIVVLKGHRTFVTDGERTHENETGNPGMATGGTGDCLTGTLAALLGQKLAPFEAAVLGVHVHGLAGDLAAAACGQVGMTALDLAEHLPAAFKALERKDG
ncbi:MAG TPA: NAD(P)H-hydrate dehydratase [Pirellulaceae bacterium]|jgi:NAD(P)H-hydrate epimerase|nr:NAD(P)H-hydrate dehydratase [Pirellulaceae bacterium]